MLRDLVELRVLTTMEDNRVSEASMSFVYQHCTGRNITRDLTQSSVSVELVKLPYDCYLDFIDTGLHLTIGQIRKHLQEKFDMPRVRLVYNGSELTDDNRNLADYGWTSGECGKIKVQDTVIYTNEIN